MENASLPPAAPARPAPFKLLDAWRGIASLAVVGFHWGEIATRSAPELAGTGIYRLTPYGFLGVQIFFVISGFCIAAAAAGLLFKRKSTQATVGGLFKAYAIARARRIFPTYWAGLAFVLAFSWAATQMARAGRIPDNIYTHFDAAHVSVWQLFTNITLLAFPLHQGLFLIVAWTLCYEIAFYLIIGLAMVFAARKARANAPAVQSVAAMLTILHGVTLVCLAWLCVSPRTVPFPLDLWPQFGMGVLLYDLLTLSPSLPARKKAVQGALYGALVLMALFVIARNVDVGGMNQPARLTFPTAGLFTLLLLFLYRHDEWLMNKKWVSALGFIGLFSYSLYLTHTVVLRIAGQLLQKAHLFPRLHLIAFVLATLISLGGAYCFFLLFEKPLLSRRKIREEPVP